MMRRPRYGGNFLFCRDQTIEGGPGELENMCYYASQKGHGIIWVLLGRGGGVTILYRSNWRLPEKGEHYWNRFSLPFDAPETA